MSGSPLSWSGSGPLPDLANIDPDLPLISSALLHRHEDALRSAAIVHPVQLDELPYFYLEPRVEIGPEHWDPKKTFLQPGRGPVVAFKKVPQAALFRIAGFDHVFWNGPLIRAITGGRPVGVETYLAWPL